jgi:hypothetical protein
MRAYYFDFAFSRVVAKKILFNRSLFFFWNWIVQWGVNLSPRLHQYYEATGLTYLFPAQNLRVELEK